MESLIIIHLVEVLPERLLLPSDRCARNTDVNVNVDKSVYAIEISTNDFMKLRYRYPLLFFTRKRTRFGPEALGFARRLKGGPETVK